MIKKISIFPFFVAILICNIYSNNIKSQAFKKNDFNISMGWGKPSILSAVFSQFIYIDTMNTHRLNVNGPYYIKVEYAVSNKIGLGLDYSFSHNHNMNYTDDYEYFTFNVHYIAFRTNCHIGHNKIFDPYIGMGIGAAFGIEINVMSNLTFGSKIYISKRFALYGEMGMDHSIFQLGGVFHFSKPKIDL